MNISTPKRDLTIKELSRLTGIGTPTLSRLAREGRLPGCYRIGHQWRVNYEIFERHRVGQETDTRDKS